MVRIHVGQPFFPQNIRNSHWFESLQGLTDNGQQILAATADFVMALNELSSCRAHEPMRLDVQRRRFMRPRARLCSFRSLEKQHFILRFVKAGVKTSLS
jgi:hypothetical protein